MSKLGKLGDGIRKRHQLLLGSASNGLLDISLRYACRILASQTVKRSPAVELAESVVSWSGLV
jgi:hypothetical protein